VITRQKLQINYGILVEIPVSFPKNSFTGEIQARKY
jgi:hypothetical protein